MTKSLATQQQLKELENAFHQLNTNTQLHQAEFLRMFNPFNELEGWVLMMALCKDTSQNVLELHH
jgi:rubrerythrin